MFLKFGFAVFASILTCAIAHADIYTVGGDAACNYTGIGAAAAAAEAHPGADTINVASPDANDPNAAYTSQAIAFTASQELDIVGGFANCSQAASSGSHTIIDGAGGATEPVFRITIITGGQVRLSYLTIQHGDEDGSGKGGGIYLKSNSFFGLDHVTVAQNIAGYGGGIYAESTGDFAQLVIGEDVAIIGNTARYDGGGIVNDGVTMTMTKPDSYIAYNEAQGVLTQPLNQWVGGKGGGLLVRGDDRSAYAYLGTSGLGNLGPIYLNKARQGGGVAVTTSGNRTLLELLSTDPARPMRIKGNSASVEGGGVYLGPSGGWSQLWVWYAWIDDNIAPHGAAIAADATDVFFNDPDFRPGGSLNCPVGTPCGGIVGNAAVDDAAQPTGGVVEITNNDYVYFSRMTMEGNTGKSVFHGDDSHTFFMTHHVAIVGNTVSGSVVATDSDSDYFEIENTTIAGNTIGDDTVMRIGNFGASLLHRSIIWQPGRTTVHVSGDPLSDLFDDMVSERASVDGGNTPYVTQLDPRFVDPAHGDYSLRAASPAVDFTTSVDADNVDLYSNPRDVNLPIVTNLWLRDLGAIERQTLQPLVLNSDFNEDLRLWNMATAGSTSWDTTRNASGAAGSGSAHVTAPSAITGTQIGGIVQCVQLPGPGLYALNGWGHGTGTMVTAGDIAELYWEYRKNGGENCMSGAPNATGTKILSSGNSWSKPATPAYIEVTKQDYTSNSSIAVTLVAVENGVSGAPTNAWFDGVTLAVEGDDRIFGSGFESP